MLDSVWRKKSFKVGDKRVLRRREGTAEGQTSVAASAVHNLPVREAGLAVCA